MWKASGTLNSIESTHFSWYHQLDHFNWGRAQRIYKFTIYICILIAVWMTSCTQEPIEPPPINAIFKAGAGAFVLCEGNFNYGNASIDYYNIETNTIHSNIYSEKNQEPIGDVLQSAQIINDELYIIVNNSQKVIVCNPSTMQKLWSIDGLVSPRYLLATGNQNLLISDIWGQDIAIYNYNSAMITGYVDMHTWTEQMIESDGSIYVTAPMSHYLYILNNTAYTVTDSIYIGYGSINITQDINGKLWVLTQGNEASGILPSLLCIDPISNTIIKSMYFNTYTKPQDMTLSDNQNIYVIQNDVYKINIADTTIPSNAWHYAGARNYYGIESNNTDIVLFDAKDYNQNGAMLIYNSNAILQLIHSVGIIPNGWVRY